MPPAWASTTRLLRFKEASFRIAPMQYTIRINVEARPVPDNLHSGPAGEGLRIESNDTIKVEGFDDVCKVVKRFHTLAKLIMKELRP